MIWNRPFHELKGVFFHMWRRIWSWGPLYWLRCHTFTRYHIIDIRGMDGYRWGWIDRDHAMYLACFKLLCDFVEKEKPEVGTLTLKDYGVEPGMQEAEAVLLQIVDDLKIRALYDWWKTDRAQEHAACERLLDGVDTSFDKMFKKEGDHHYYVGTEDPRFEQWAAENKRLNDKDEEMLMQLMKVRGRLWT